MVGVVTTPFEFEGPKRMQGAVMGLEELKSAVDSLITIPNEKILEECEDLLMQEAYAKANDVLLNAVRGISDVVIKPGMINVDFADVKTVMAEAGLAMMGIGSASGEKPHGKSGDQRNQKSVAFRCGCFQRTRIARECNQFG